MFLSCVTSTAAEARVHTAQIPQGAHIRHTPHMSVFKIDDQSRPEVFTACQRTVARVHKTMSDKKSMRNVDASCGRTEWGGHYTPSAMLKRPSP